MQIRKNTPLCLTRILRSFKSFLMAWPPTGHSMWSKKTMRAKKTQKRSKTRNLVLGLGMVSHSALTRTRIWLLSLLSDPLQTIRRLRLDKVMNAISLIYLSKATKTKASKRLKLMMIHIASSTWSVNTLTRTKELLWLLLLSSSGSRSWTSLRRVLASANSLKGRSRSRK